MSQKHQPLHRRPVELLQRLIQFDTTNPPGGESACVEFIEGLLRQAGLQTRVLSKADGRSNLVARIPGRGDAPAVMLTGHLDVVTTQNQEWIHPPFEGRIEDGAVWGRGALDMKGGVAMMLAAVLRALEDGVRPAGDIVLLFVADEEAGGRLGASFLVDEHPDLFDGVQYAIGEFGGFPLWLRGRQFTMIQVAEKQPCWIEVTIRGPAGHGSRPMRGGAMARLARILNRLERIRLPIHITPVAKQMIHSLASGLPRAQGLLLRQLLNPKWTDRALRALGEAGRVFEPLFRNTANATIVQGGDKVNVIPSRIRLSFDGRILPGYTDRDLLTELSPILRSDADAEVLLYDPVPAGVDLGLFDQLCSALRAHDPVSVPVPFLLPGSTDGRHFARLGIQSYGFTPMLLPQQFTFFDTIHAANERIPVEAVEFGVTVLYDFLKNYRHPSR